MIKLFLADDHILIRDGLELLVSKQEDMEVIGRASNGRNAVEWALALKPDVVLMDIAMPELNGIEATQRLQEADPSIRVIGLSMHHETHYVVKMIQAGARGYLLKHCAYDELCDAVHSVMAGKLYLCRHLTGVKLEESGVKMEGVQSIYTLLTAREREVMQMLAEGLNIKQIAVRCGVSVKTVETHRYHIMTKLQLENMAELTRFAIREGIITP